MSTDRRMDDTIKVGQKHIPISPTDSLKKRKHRKKMGYVIRRGRRWRLSELGEPQCKATRSVCAEVWSSVWQLQLTAL